VPNSAISPRQTEVVGHRPAFFGAKSAEPAVTPVVYIRADAAPPSKHNSSKPIVFVAALLLPQLSIFQEAFAKIFMLYEQSKLY